MARTNLTVTQVKNGGFLPINAGDLAAPRSAADVANGNKALVGDGITLSVLNSGASPYTVDITVPDDEHGRAGSIQNYSIPAGEEHDIYIPSRLAQKSGADSGYVLIDGENASLKFKATRQPSNTR